jgi:hypothetical protein
VILVGVPSQMPRFSSASMAKSLGRVEPCIPMPRENSSSTRLPVPAISISRLRRRHLATKKRAGLCPGVRLIDCIGLILFLSPSNYPHSRPLLYPVNLMSDDPSRPHNIAMNLTVRPVTRLAGLLPQRDSHGRAQGARPSRPAGYRGRYAASS